MKRNQTEIAENDKFNAVNGGYDPAEDVHCPKCRSFDIETADPGDFGTLPTYRCRKCGYEWMRPL